MSVRAIVSWKRVGGETARGLAPRQRHRNAAMRWSAVKSPASSAALPMSSAEQAEQMLLQSRHARGERRDLREREAAQHHRVQRHRIAGIARVRDRVEPDHLARQVEAQHVLAPFAVDDVGLDRARAHRGDGLERIAFAEDVLALVRTGRHARPARAVRQPRLVHALRQAGAENAQVLQKRSASPSSAIGLDAGAREWRMSAARAAAPRAAQIAREMARQCLGYGG